MVIVNRYSLQIMMYHWQMAKPRRLFQTLTGFTGVKIVTEGAGDVAELSNDWLLLLSLQLDSEMTGLATCIPPFHIYRLDIDVTRRYIEICPNRFTLNVSLTTAD